MSYEVEYLYRFEKNNEIVYRYLFNFITNDDITKNVEIDVVILDNGFKMIDIVYEESDSLTDDDEDLLFYLLNRWAASTYND